MVEVVQVGKVKNVCYRYNVVSLRLPKVHAIPVLVSLAIKQVVFGVPILGRFYMWTAVDEVIGVFRRCSRRRVASFFYFLQLCHGHHFCEFRPNGALFVLCQAFYVRGVPMLIPFVIFHRLIRRYPECPVGVSNLFLPIGDCLCSYSLGVENCLEVFLAFPVGRIFQFYLPMSIVYVRLPYTRPSTIEGLLRRQVRRFLLQSPATVVAARMSNSLSCYRPVLLVRTPNGAGSTTSIVPKDYVQG